jgi:hypothetical protein
MARPPSYPFRPESSASLAPDLFSAAPLPKGRLACVYWTYGFIEQLGEQLAARGEHDPSLRPG